MMNLKNAMMQMGTGLPTHSAPVAKMPASPPVAAMSKAPGDAGGHFATAHKHAKSGNHKLAKAFAFKGIKALPAMPDMDKDGM